MERQIGSNKRTHHYDQAARKEVAMLNTYEHNLAFTAKQWGEIIPQGRASYYPGVYSQRPVLLETLSQWSGYSENLSHARAILDDLPAELKGPWSQASANIDENIAKNPLAITVNGTSVEDIGRMSLPLSTSDIKKIDAVLKYRGKAANNLCYMQDVICLAATQAELYPKAALSSPARALVQRLKNYWEYYTSWFINSDSNEYFISKMIRGGVLLDGLLVFTPLRLRISPSSVRRLIDAKTDFFMGRVALRRLGLTDKIDLYLNSIDNPRVVPQELSQYQFTDTQTEEELSKTLRRVYKEQAKADSTQDLVQNLLLYQRQLRYSVKASENESIRIPASPDGFFKEVIIGVIYGKTLSITGWAEGGTFVTLDLIQDGRLFGIPHALQRRNPAFGHLLVKEILTPVLEESRRRYPSVESQFLQFVPSPAFQKGVEREAPNPNKRKGFGAFRLIARYREVPELPADSLPKEDDEDDRYLLIYKGKPVCSEKAQDLAAKIAEDLIPNDQRLPNDIRLIIDSLATDPFGPGTYKITHATTGTKNGRRVPLRSFRGDKRRLPFQYKEFSDRLRAVHITDKNAKSVTLVDILPHDKFDRLYSSGS